MIRSPDSFLVSAASSPTTAEVDAFVAALPPEYELTHAEPAPGLLDLQALVFEPTGSPSP